MPALDIPTLPAPGPAPTLPADRARAMAAEADPDLAPVPPAFARLRRPNPLPPAVFAPPPAADPAPAPDAQAPQREPLKLSALPAVEIPPYPFAPRAAVAGDPVERTFKAIDRIVQGHLLKPYCGDVQAELADLREHWRLEMETRPAAQPTA